MNSTRNILQFDIKTNHRNYSNIPEIHFKSNQLRTYHNNQLRTLLYLQKFPHILRVIGYES